MSFPRYLVTSAIFQFSILLRLLLQLCNLPTRVPDVRYRSTFTGLLKSLESFLSSREPRDRSVERRIEDLHLSTGWIESKGGSDKFWSPFRSNLAARRPYPTSSIFRLKTCPSSCPPAILLVRYSAQTSFRHPRDEKRAKILLDGLSTSLVQWSSSKGFSGRCQIVTIRSSFRSRQSFGHQADYIKVLSGLKHSFKVPLF